MTSLIIRDAPIWKLCTDKYSNIDIFLFIAHFVYFVAVHLILTKLALGIVCTWPSFKHFVICYHSLVVAVKSHSIFFVHKGASSPLIQRRAQKLKWRKTRSNSMWTPESSASSQISLTMSGESKDLKRLELNCELYKSYTVSGQRSIHLKFFPSQICFRVFEFSVYKQLGICWSSMPH